MKNQENQNQFPETETTNGLVFEDDQTSRTSVETVSSQEQRNEDCFQIYFEQSPNFGSDEYNDILF